MKSYPKRNLMNRSEGALATQTDHGNDVNCACSPGC